MASCDAKRAAVKAVLNDIGGVVTWVDETIGEGWSLFDGQDNAASYRIRKADRGDVRLDNDRRGPVPDQAQRPSEGGRAVTFAAAWDLARVPKLLPT